MSRDAGHDAARGGPITGWAAVTESPRTEARDRRVPVTAPINS